MFLLVFVINPLIILNLFISIVGNALEKIKDDHVIREKQELAEMILEAEILFFWNRRKNKKKFLHFCHEVQADVVFGNEITERIKWTAEKTDQLIKIFDKNSAEILMLKNSFQKKLGDIESKADLMLKSIKAE